jgi:hypothetical protein
MPVRAGLRSRLTTSAAFCIPRGKLGWGADGAYGDVSLTNAVPVQPGTGVTFPVSLAAVSGFNLAQYGGTAVGAANPLHIQPGSGATFAVTDGGGSLTVDGTVGVTQGGAWSVSITGTPAVDTELPAAAALADATANPTAPAVASFAHGYNGATWDRLRSTTANGLAVDVTRVQGNVAVTGTFWQATQPVSGTVTANQGGAPWSNNVTQLGGTAVDTNSGNKSAGTLRVVLATDQPALTNAQPVNVAQVGGTAAATGNGAVTAGCPRVALADVSAGKYETVAASQTDQALGPTGATGDYLAGVLIVPATTSPGAVSIKDGGGSAITIFAGGASSVSNLVPFFVPLGIISTGGAWKVTTGTNVSAIGVGNFT